MKIQFTLEVAPLDDIDVAARARLQHLTLEANIFTSMDIIAACLERRVPPGHRITQVQVETTHTPDGAATIAGLKPLG